ncbi:sensor histidine kinase [Jiulongibacter sediminis]|uniref:sensor histidine kinase n=1 Tax=Jiulongibacter sediminis TaxID=1605367 RepID=UPI0006DC23F7|nr:PAS domain-containing sensor histidine kinase [Jiulongibacter sediminis]
MKNVFVDQVRKQETRFEDRALYEAMSDGFVIITTDTLEVEYSNKNFESFESEFEREKVISLLKDLVKGDISEDDLAQMAGYSKISVKKVSLSDSTEAKLIVLVKNRKMPFRGHYQILNEAESKMAMGTWQYLLQEDKLSVSDGMMNLFGFSPEDVEHFPQDIQSYLSFVIEEDRKRVTDALAYVIETSSQVEDLEHRIIDRNGKMRLLSISTLKLLTANSKVYSAQGIIRDITNIRKNETEIADNIKKLNQSNEALSEFAYTASHDLQEPLRKIEAYGNRLKKSLGDQLSEKSEHYMDKMISATTRMSDLIDDILKLSRVSSTQIEPEKISLMTVLDGIVGDYEESIRDTRAVIEYDLPELMGSDTQFHQLFQNLISNSLKFRAEDRVPAIHISHSGLSAEKAKKLGLSTITPYYEIVYKDNGIGFEQQFASKIFTPFKRLFGRAEFPGTGIGLAIVKKVVENHNGIIDVISKEGEGTTFYIYLPKT